MADVIGQALKAGYVILPLAQLRARDQAVADATVKAVLAAEPLPSKAALPAEPLAVRIVEMPARRRVTRSEVRRDVDGQVESTVQESIET